MGGVEIRPATRADMADLLRLGQMFVSSTILARSVPFDARSCEQSFTYCLNTPSACVFVMTCDGIPVGFISGELIPAYWNYGATVGQQYSWFVDPAHRSRHSIRLLHAFEHWCRAEGATVVMGSAKDGTGEEGMKKMFERRGFQHLEQHYLLEVR